MLLCLSLLLAAFSVNVSAASDTNLIDPDLSTWEAMNDSFSFLSKNGINRLTAKGTTYETSTGGSYSLFNGIIYDLPSFVAGHSYTISFKLPGGDEIGEAWNTTYTDDKVIAYYNNASLVVGYGFLSADGSTLESSNNLYEITSDNIGKYVGKTMKTSFVASSASGRPCVFIWVLASDTNNHLFFISDISLVDNDDNSAELTGIKGFLHSIRWDLVGGVCEEEDCPHSLETNPHLSLTERLTAGFSSMFESIGSKFEEGSTLNLWFNDLSSGVTDLGDRVDGFFSGLGDRIGGFFDNLTSGMTDGFSDVGSWFTDLGNDLSSWFDGVKQKFQEVGDSITTKFQEIGDKFTEFFDKFKPRVFVDLKWERGLVHWSTGELYLKDENYPYVVVSELFTVPHGTKYLLDYIDSDETSSLAIHKYDLNGNFIRSDAYAFSFEAMELESGYQYRFRTQYTPGVEDLSIVNDYVMLYSDEGWINALVNNLQSTIKGLFIPDDEFIESWKSDLTTCLEEHLGFIYTSFDFIGDFFTKLKDLLGSSKDGKLEFVLPAVNFELNGVRYDLWDDKPVDMSFLNEGVWGTLYGFYKILLYIIIIFALLNYSVNVYWRIMHQ